MNRESQSKLSYPIQLYMPRLWALVMIPFGVFCIWIARLEVFTGAKAEIVPKIYGIISTLIGIFIIVSGIIIAFKRSPTLVITATGFSQYSSSKSCDEIRYYWRDINAINLSYYSSRGVKNWYLKVTINEGKVLRITLKSMYHNNDLLDVHAIYGLMQKSLSDYQKKREEVNDI